MDKTDFDPTIKRKTMSTKKYIEHLKNVHEMSKDAGIPMGADALFGKPASYTNNSIYPTANRVPSEPELRTENSLTAAKIRAYEDF